MLSVASILQKKDNIMSIRRFLFFVFCIGMYNRTCQQLYRWGKVPEFLRFEGEKTVVADSVLLDKMIGEMDKKHPESKMKFFLFVLADDELNVYSDYRLSATSILSIMTRR